MMKFGLFNVVWYDGVDAYVSKFVLPVEKAGEVTEIGRKAAMNYLSGNGEILKYDFLYTVTLDNIVAFKNSDKTEMAASYDRFNEMFFTA